MMSGFIFIGWILNPIVILQVDVYGNPNAYTQQVLTVGDLPPDLRIEKWLQGAPIASFEKGKVYVVEFWASWCNPCQKSVPHLNKVQENYADQGLEVVAIAANEDHGHGKEKGSTPLEQFLKRRGRNITYTVGFTSDAEVYRSWVEAARLSGLPWVFVIDRQGRIAWIGQPFHEGFEPALEQVVAGTHSLDQWKRRHELMQGERTKGWDLARKFWTALDAKEWQTALGYSRSLAEMDSDWFYYEATMAFEILWSHTQQKEEALEFAKLAQEGFLKKKPEGLAAMAEVMLAEKSLTKKQMAQAHALAQHAVDLTGGEDPSSLALLAKAEALSGNLLGAERYLKMALPLADPSLQGDIQRDLALLKRQK